MKTALMTAIVLFAIAGCSSSSPKQPASAAEERSEDIYVITAHTVIQLKPVYLGGYLQTGLPTQEDDYTVQYGADVLKVKYQSSQTSSAKPGDFPGAGLHEHSTRDPDLTQVPPAGVPIRACIMSKDRDSEGGPIIAEQPTPAPCMARIGDELQYEPAPNSGDFTYVVFDIISERQIQKREIAQAMQRNREIAAPDSVKSKSLPPGVLKALAADEKEYCDDVLGELKKGCHQTFRANLSWLELVITPSEQTAILVLDENRGSCGSAGCGLSLFVQQPDAKYTQVLGWEVGTLQSIDVLKTVTKNHYNIQKTWRDGKTRTLYMWDGRRYSAEAAPRTQVDDE